MASVPVPGSPTGRPASGDPRPGPSSAPPAPGRPPQSSEEQAGRGPPARFSIRPASSRSAGAVSGMRRPSLLELRSIFEGDPEAGGPRSPPRESRRRENSESGGGETRGAARTGPSSGGALPPRVVPKPPVETSAAQMRNKSPAPLWPGSGSCTPGTANPGVDRPGWKQDFHDRSKSLDWRESSRAGPGFEKEANGPVRTAAPEERKPGATQWGSSPPRPPWNQDRGGGSDQRAARVFSETAPGADPQRRGRPAWRRGDEERAAAWVRSASLDSAPRLGNPPADPDGEEKAGGGDPWVGGPPAGSDPRGSRPRTGTEDECDSPAPKPTVPDSRTAAAPQEDTSEPGSPLVVEGPLPLGPIAGNFNNNSSNGLPPSPLARAGLAPPSRPAGHLPDLVPSGLLREPHPGKTPFPRTCSPGLPRPPDQTGESLRPPPPAAPESRDTWGRWSSEEEDSRSESSESSEGHDTDSDRSDSGSSSLTITSSFSQSDRRSFSVSLADLCGLGGADDWDDSDAEDSRSLRSASLSSSMSSALSMVSIIPHDELESLLDDVRAAGEETLACPRLGTPLSGQGAVSSLRTAGPDRNNGSVRLCPQVHRVFPCGLAAQEGSIREGDRVLSINGTALQAAAHWEALRTLRRARSREQAIVVLRKGTCTPAATAEPQGTQPHGLPTGDAQPGKTVHLILTKSSSDLGFSLEGGRGSNQGDRPLTVKKVFPGGPVDQVLPGDEVLEVKGRSLRGLRRLEAWNWIKMLPPGPVEVLLQRPCRL
nr:PREDICTED: pro-interleukin-16-like [Lepisosteus oculatus]